MIPTIVEPPPLVQSTSSTSRRSSAHSLNPEYAAGHPLHKRIFVGPLLEKELEAVANPKGKKRLLPRIGSADEGDANISQFVKDHALAFFIQQGGNEEDWEEANEESVREEMLRRWRESEWAGFRRRKDKNAKQQTKWVGGSFEVGNILGVNVLQDAESNRSTRMGASSSYLPLSTDGHASLTHAATSFLTAPNAAPSTIPAPPSLLGVDGPEDMRRTQSDYGASGDSSTRLAPETSLHPAKSDSHVPVVKAQRRVHYAAPPEMDSRDSTPAPPSEVLEREPEDIPDTSAAATIPNTPPSPHHSSWEDFTMRDRMLVRVGYTRNESLGPVFDEEISRTARGVRYEQWEEFIVLWRKNAIHFYETHNVPGTRWISGTRYRLAYVVPLKTGKTKLSLYSFTDLTFCLTCEPTMIRSKVQNIRSKALFQRLKEGTNIFICKIKSRTRAADWMWAIWRRLGGTLPATIDVRNPTLDVHVKIETPELYLRSRDAPEIFTITNVMRLCMRELRRVADWEELIERNLALGKSLKLAWRSGTQLDWIYEELDVCGDPRSCAVLCGLAMQQSFPSPTLELRLAQHVPQYSVLKHGEHFPEPPCIEGYLERIRPNTQSKVLVYLVSHEGCLFSLAAAHSNPPSPLGVDPNVQDAESLRVSEMQRGAKQIFEATGVVDLRSVLAVRRAFQPIVPATHDRQPTAEDTSSIHPGTPVERTTSDDEDEGGEESLRVAQDKLHVKMKRSFELLLKNGHVIRFEAHSRKVALEWVERLRELLVYWKQRHRIDAAEEMDLAQAYRPRLTPRRHVMRNDSELPPEAPMDLTAALPTLSNMYPLCCLESCKPIIRSGRLFMRRGFYGQYKYIHLFLVPGHLVQFSISPQSSLHLAMHKQVSLADAYVCSGFVAASSLPIGQYSANQAPLPRRYQDGLETDDSDEDTMFIVWYHPHRNTEDEAGPPVPALDAKTKRVVFRCRNRLERDTWCWALNSEIERLGRSRKEREDKIRNMGAGRLT
ncbi:hypothetical protein HMN09_01251000 [Mycena chlorophos]|uniref:PH domain-containing protein n=1 Tax=Mycena chlorophos TaxID=658473 RepID=A0A8H6VRY5_MYCCL|nr:hypothetical protein HMN09_01251000 [Mycena chlorophos]